MILSSAPGSGKRRLRPYGTSSSTTIKTAENPRSWGSCHRNLPSHSPCTITGIVEMISSLEGRMQLASSGHTFL